MILNAKGALDDSVVRRVCLSCIGSFDARNSAARLIGSDPSSHKGSEHAQRWLIRSPFEHLPPSLRTPFASFSPL